MPVEFISAIHPNRASDGEPVLGLGIDPDHTRKFARALDDGGFDYTLVAYHSSSPDALQLAQFVVNHTERLKPMLAHRPGVIFPTHAARAFATLDRISKGRLAVHIISGGSDEEQRREGDYLSKSERYARSDEYIQILRKVWSADGPVSHEGAHYRFEGFSSQVTPYQTTIPVSVGGSSQDAYRVGGQQGDIFGLWGEPLKETAEQIASVNAYADEAGRPRPRIWVSFRPIIAPTDELAWEKAHRILGQVKAGHTERAKNTHYPVFGTGRPANVGSQRLLDVAARGDLHDRALWTPWPPPPTPPAPPPRWSARPKPWRRRCWTTSTSAASCCPSGAGTRSTTPSTTPASSSRWSARNSPTAPRRPRSPPDPT